MGEHELRMHYLKDREEKCPAPGEIWTHDLSSYCSQGAHSTAVLQPLPYLKKWVMRYKVVPFWVWALYAPWLRKEEDSLA